MPAITLQPNKATIRHQSGICANCLGTRSGAATLTYMSPASPSSPATMTAARIVINADASVGIPVSSRIHVLGHLDRISSLIDHLTERIGVLVGWLTLLMVCLGAFNAIARYAGRFTGTNLSSNAYLELQWYMFSLIFLLGAAYTFQRDQHVRVDVLYGGLSPKAKARIDLTGGVLFLLPFCIFGLIMSWPAVRNSWAVWEISPDPGGLPRYPIKSAMLVCFGLLFLQGVSDIIKRIRILRGGAE